MAIVTIGVALVVCYFYPWIAPIIRVRSKRQKKNDGKDRGEQINAVIEEQEEDPMEQYNYFPTVYAVNYGGRQRLPHVSIKIGRDEYKALVDTEPQCP
jgi:hypothetical protein